MKRVSPIDVTRKILISKNLDDVSEPNPFPLKLIVFVRGANEIWSAMRGSASMRTS